MCAMIEKSKAIDEVRLMAYQFADMYFAFVDEIRKEYGDETAKKIANAVLYRRARERAEAMIKKAEELGIERIPDNIHDMSDVPYLGWQNSLGADHCPYGAQWKKRIKENPWFEPYANLYCDVTDTSIAEIFTGRYSHKLTCNIVNGCETCERVYFEDAEVADGKRTYAPEEK